MELRSQLMPPQLDEARIALLAKLASAIDGAQPGTWEDALDEFNCIAGTSLEWLEFQGVYGGMAHETWVRQVLSEPYAVKIPDIAYDELLEIFTRVCTSGHKEHETYFWIKLLEANLADPRISDLLYWPGEYFGDDDNMREMTPKEKLDAALKNQRKFPTL